MAGGKRADWLGLGGDAVVAGVSAAGRVNRWLFAGSSQQMRDVFVAGQPVIQQGHHAAEEAAAAGFARAMRALQ